MTFFPAASVDLKFALYSLTLQKDDSILSIIDFTPYLFRIFFESYQVISSN